MNLALGASLLFLANITFIIAAVISPFSGWACTLAATGGQQLESDALVVGCALRHHRGSNGRIRAIGLAAIDESHIRDRLEAEVFRGATVVEYHVVSSAPMGVQMIVQSESR